MSLHKFCNLNLILNGHFSKFLLSFLVPMALTLFQWQVVNVSFFSMQPSVSFDTGATRTLKQIEANISCLNSDLMLVSIYGKHHIPKHDTKDLKFKTYHLLKHVKFWLVAWHKFQCPSSPRVETYCPSKHVKFGEVCFSAMHTCSMCPMQKPSIML